MDRHALIARKDEVRRLLEVVQREIERGQALPSTWQMRRHMGGLQRQVEQLMAEEYALRLAIDRAG